MNNMEASKGTPKTLREAILNGFLATIDTNTPANTTVDSIVSHVEDWMKQKLQAAYLETECTYSQPIGPLQRLETTLFKKD